MSQGKKGDCILRNLKPESLPPGEEKGKGCGQSGKGCYLYRMCGDCVMDTVVNFLASTLPKSNIA